MKNSASYAVLLTAFFFLGIQQIGLGQFLTEDFDYPAGELLTNVGWTAHSGGGTQPVTVNNGGLSFPEYISGGIGNAALLDNNGEDVNRTFPVQSSGIVYAAFMVKISTFSSGYFLHLGGNPIGTTFRGKVFMDASSHFGLSFGSNTATLAGTAFSTGSTYLLVLKYDIVAGSSNDKVSLYVFESGLPSTEPASPTIGPLSDAGLSDITPAAVALRQYSTSQNLVLDGLRITNSWSDIIGAAIIAPTIQASNLTFSNVTGTGITSSWSKGNGDKRVVIISPSASITAPSDGSDPVADSVYAGSGEQVVYNGSDSIVSASGLTPGSTYWFQVFEYNGTGANTKYSSAVGANNPSSQSTIFVTTAPLVTNPVAISISVNTAVLGGTIVSDGGSAITERGTVWSINSPVTINDNKLAEGSAATGSFSHLRTGLPAGMELFYAAYATNGIGTTLSPQASFSSLSQEPGSQATNFTSPSDLHTSITVTWSDNDGAQPATAFLVLANTTGTFTVPVDGVPQTNDTILNDGSGKVNVPHGIQSYTWVGLNPSTTYYFAVYPYTNSGTGIDYKTSVANPTSNATTTAIPVYTYTWTGENYAAWTTASNWTPGRTTPSTTDILQFNDGTIKTVTGVMTQTIGRLIISANTKVTLQSSAAVTLSINNSTGTDLEVQSGCELNLSGTNAIIVSLLSGATGSISGSIVFSSGAHRLISAAVSGVIFNSNSIFQAATGFSGNAFGSAAPYNAVVFSNGSTYVSKAGSNPFGTTAPNSVVIFQPGSLFKVIAGVTPAFSGRTYGNFELDAPGATITPIGSGAVSIQNLTVTNGTLNFNMTGSPGHSIKGNLSVAAGATLNFSPSSAGTITFDGTTEQMVSGGGSITWSTLSTLIISNPANVTVTTSATINGILSLSDGWLILSSGDLMLGTNAGISGTPSSSTMIVATGTGQLRKEMPSALASFTFPVGDNTGIPEYSPVTLTFTSGTVGSGNYIGINLINAAYPGNPLTGNYINRYWNIYSSGITGFTCDAAFSYAAPADVVGDENLISCVQISGTPVIYNTANVMLHQLTASNLTSFGSFTGAQMTKTLDLMLFLEGLYAGGGLMNKAQDASGDKFPGNTADQIIIELHDASPGSYATLVYSSGLVNLSASGQVSLTIPVVHNSSYFITARHRSSIETVSAVPVSFSGNTISYNFTDAALRAYGNNLQLSADGTYVIFVGDVNQDGIVDSGDMISVDNDVSNFQTGYVNGDVNGDGLLDSTDLIMVDNNSNQFISVITP